MADRTPYPGSTADDGLAPERGSSTTAATYPGTPRWVTLFGIVVIGLVLLVVVVLVVGTALGLHTPGGPGGHGL